MSWLPVLLIHLPASSGDADGGSGDQGDAGQAPGSCLTQPSFCEHWPTKPAGGDSVYPFSSSSLRRKKKKNGEQNLKKNSIPGTRKKGLKGCPYISGTKSELQITKHIPFKGDWAR